MLASSVKVEKEREDMFGGVRISVGDDEKETDKERRQDSIVLGITLLVLLTSQFSLGLRISLGLCN